MNLLACLDQWHLLGRIMNAVDSAIDPFLGSAVFGGLSRFGACVVQKLETGAVMPQF
jgi:hypothetical protein